MPRNTDFLTNEQWATPSSLVAEHGFGADPARTASTVAVRAAIATRSTVAQGGEVGCARMLAMRMNHAEMTVWQRDAFCETQEYPTSFDLTIPLAKTKKGSSDLIATPGAREAVHPEMTTTEMNAIVKKFDGMYDGVPDLRSLEGVTALNVIHVPKGVLKPGAQTFDDIVQSSYGGRPVEHKSFLLLMLVIEAISSSADPSTFEVAFETLQEQEFDMEPRVINIHDNARARSRATREYAPRGKGKEEEDENTPPGLGGEAIVNAEIPRPIVRNISIEDLVEGKLTPSNIASVVRPDRYVGFRMWIIERGGKDLAKAIKVVLDRNDMRHDPDNRRMYDRDLAKKPLSECTPREYGMKIQAKNIPNIISGYYDELDWVGRTTSPKETAAALSPFNYFRRAAIITHSKLTFAQTSMRAYILSPIGSRGRVSFPSGMNVFFYEGSEIGRLTGAYLPWTQAWIVAPIIREHCRDSGRISVPMQGVSGVEPEIKFGTVQDSHIAQAGSGENSYYRILTSDELKERMLKKASTKARTWVEEGGDAINDSAPAGDDILLLLYRSILPESETNVVMGRSLQNKHPREAAKQRWKKVMAQRDEMKKDGKELPDLDALRKEHISQYFLHMGMGSAAVSPAEQATHNYGVNETPKHRWDLPSHPIFDPQFSLGDELRAQFFAVIGCLTGNVDRTGLAMLVSMFGLTCYDYTDMRPHLLMLGPPGASKSWFMRILQRLSLKYRNPDGSEDGPVNFVMRPTTQALSNDTPDGATIVAMDEFPDGIIRIGPDNNGANTNWKTVLAGGSSSTFEIKFNEETGARERHMGKGTPARMTMVAASNSPMESTTAGDVDEALVDRLLTVLVMVSTGSEDRNVQMMIEYLKNQPEEHKKQRLYFESIYKVMQTFQMAIMDLMEAGIFDEYDMNVPIEIFGGICRESEKLKNANSKPISTRKQKQFLSLVSAVALFEGIANTYLDPRSPLYGVPPNVQEHVWDVYLNTGAIGPNVAIAAAGLMTPVFENPVLDIVIDAINSIPIENCFFAAESKVYEMDKEKESDRSFAAIAATSKGSMAVVGSGSGPGPSSSGSVKGIDGMSSNEMANLLAGFDEYEKNQQAASARKSEVRAAITKQLSERKKALSREENAPDKTQAEKNRAKRRIAKEIDDLKRKAVQLEKADEYMVNDLATRFRVGSGSAHRRRVVRRGMVLHPEWRTFNLSLEEMVKRVLRLALLRSGARVSGRIVMSVIQTMFVKSRKYRFLGDPGPVTTSVPVDSLSVEVTDIENAPQVEAFSVQSDALTRKQTVWVRAELFGGCIVSTSYLSIVEKVARRVIRCREWCKFQLLHEVPEFPQFMRVIRVAPREGTTTTVTAAPLDRGEQLLLFGSKREVKAGPARLNITQYEEASDYPPVRNFFSKKSFVQAMEPDVRKAYFLGMTPQNKKKRAMETELAVPRIAGPLNYPDDFIESKGTENRARAQLIKVARAGHNLKSVPEGSLVDPGAGVTWKRVILEDGSTGAYFVRTDQDVLALPAPSSQPQTPMASIPGEGAMVAFARPKTPSTPSAFAARDLYDIKRKKLVEEGKAAAPVDKFQLSTYERQAAMRPHMMTYADPNEAEEDEPEASDAITLAEMLESVLGEPSDVSDGFAYDPDALDAEAAIDAEYCNLGAADEFLSEAVVHPPRMHDGYLFAGMDSITTLPSEEASKRAEEVAKSKRLPVVNASEMFSTSNPTEDDELPELLGDAEDWSVGLVFDHGIGPSYDPRLDITSGAILDDLVFDNVLVYRGLLFLVSHSAETCRFSLEAAPMLHEVDGVVYLDPGHASILYSASVRQASIWGTDCQGGDPYNMSKLFEQFRRENADKFVVTDADMKGGEATAAASRKRGMDDVSDVPDEQDLEDMFFFSKRPTKKIKPLSARE